MSRQDEFAAALTALTGISSIGLGTLVVPAVRFSLVPRQRSVLSLLGVVVLALCWGGYLVVRDAALVYFGCILSVLYCAVTIRFSPLPSRSAVPTWSCRIRDLITVYVTYAFVVGTASGLAALYILLFVGRVPTRVNLDLGVFPVLVVVLVHVGVLVLPALAVWLRARVLGQARRSAQRERDGVRRAELERSAQEGRLSLDRLSREEFDDRAVELLRRLIAATDWVVGRAVTTRQLAGADAMSETRAMVEHLERMTFCTQVVRPNADPEELVVLTEEGYRRGRSQHSTLIVGEVTVGDYFEVGNHSTVINRSTLQNSMNRVDGSTAKALGEIGKHLEEAGSDEAVELFDQFNEELVKESPRKSVLRTLFQGVERAVPTVVNLAEATAKVGELFT